MILNCQEYAVTKHGFGYVTEKIKYDCTTLYYKTNLSSYMFVQREPLCSTIFTNFKYNAQNNKSNQINII